MYPEPYPDVSRPDLPVVIVELVALAHVVLAQPVLPPRQKKEEASAWREHAAFGSVRQPPASASASMRWSAARWALQLPPCFAPAWATVSRQGLCAWLCRAAPVIETILATVCIAHGTRGLDCLTRRPLGEWRRTLQVWSQTSFLSMLSVQPLARQGLMSKP